MISSKDFDRVRIFTKFVKGRCTISGPEKRKSRRLAGPGNLFCQRKTDRGLKISGETACPAPAGQAVYA
jgi:hypothetical protein